MLFGRPTQISLPISSSSDPRDGEDEEDSSLPVTLKGLEICDVFSLHCQRSGWKEKIEGTALTKWKVLRTLIPICTDARGAVGWTGWDDSQGKMKSEAEDGVNREACIWGYVSDKNKKLEKELTSKGLSGTLGRLRSRVIYMFFRGQ